MRRWPCSCFLVNRSGLCPPAPISARYQGSETDSLGDWFYYTAFSATIGHTCKPGRQIRSEKTLAFYPLNQARLLAQANTTTNSGRCSHAAVGLSGSKQGSVTTCMRLLCSQGSYVRSLEGFSPLCCLGRQNRWGSSRKLMRNIYNRGKNPTPK